jgi:hypothetical protein
VLPPPLQGSLPAGWLAFTGRESNPQDRYKRFQIAVSSSFSGFVLAQGKFHLNLPLRSDHSITSSARASRVGAILTPRDLAVLRLMTSSMLVGNSTGRSAGFSPLRMRST